jgi:Conserved TM helix
MSETLAVAHVDVSGPLSDMLRAVLLFLPKALAFLAIIVVGWLVARVLRTAVDKVLERVGFDRAVERGGLRTTLARSRYDASDLVAKLVYYAVLLFTLQLAFGIWGPNPVSALLGGIVAWLPKAFVAILIVVITAAIAGAVRDVVGNALGGLSYGRMLANVASWFIIVLGVIAALNQVGVATTVTTPILIAILATMAGILIVGVGGGLVRPMERRWESWLDRVTEESQAIAEHARAYSAGQADAHAVMTGVAKVPEAAQIPEAEAARTSQFPAVEPQAAQPQVYAHQPARPAPPPPAPQPPAPQPPAPQPPASPAGSKSPADSNEATQVLPPVPGERPRDNR